MITFNRAEAIPIGKYPSKVVIRWDASVVSGATLDEYEFLVERQVHGQAAKPGHQDVDIDGNPTTPQNEYLHSDPFVAISTWIPGLDFPWFVDYSDELRNLIKLSYYRVRARHKKTQDEIVTQPFSWDGDIDLVGLYVVDEHNFLLSDVIGVPSLVYQRRRGGISCDACYDKIQRKRLSSSCTTCYGTNWKGGFFNPIDVYIDFSPNPKSVSIEAFGEFQQTETAALMSNFPIVAPGDIIMEVREKRLWRVTLVNETEKRRCPMLQFLKIMEVKPGDIEYKLPYDERFVARKVTEFEKLKERVEF